MSDTKHRIATVSELESEGSRVIEEINGREIAVFNIGGEYHAVLNYCVHQSGPLCHGGLTRDVQVGEDGWTWEYATEEQIIACPWHGWKFDIETGQNIDDERYRVPTYETEVVDGDVFVIF